jgi:hypothetical protein
VSEPSLFSTEELYQMNKFFLRNRIRACEKPSQAEYLTNLVKKWGGDECLASMSSDEGTLDPEKLRRALWDIKKYSEITYLSNCFDFDPTPANLKALENSSLSDPAFTSFVRRVADSAPKYFEANSFTNRNLGMLISDAVRQSNQPEKHMKALEIGLYGKADRTGIIEKSMLLGQSKFLQRLSKLYSSLASSSK